MTRHERSVADGPGASAWPDRARSRSVAVPTIGFDELEAKIRRGEDFELVEALSPGDFRDGHLPGARNLPPGRVRDLAPAILPDRGADIVVYSASAACGASTRTLRLLRRLGYSDVRAYVGGKADWLARKGKDTLQ